MDLGKIADRKGLYLKLRGEHRYGETINADSGAYFATNRSAGCRLLAATMSIGERPVYPSISERFAVFWQDGHPRRRLTECVCQWSRQNSVLKRRLCC